MNPVEDALAFRGRMREAHQQVADARRRETETAKAHREAVAARKDAERRQAALLDQEMAPVPLLDWAAENHPSYPPSPIASLEDTLAAGAALDEAEAAEPTPEEVLRMKEWQPERVCDLHPPAPTHKMALGEMVPIDQPPKKKRGKPRKAKDPPPCVPSAVSRDTFLIDLLPGKDVSKVGQALEEAGLRTVFDLLAHAASDVAKKAHPGPDSQRPYSILRAAKGVGARAAEQIGDALVDAGLIQV